MAFVWNAFILPDSFLNIQGGHFLVVVILWQCNSSGYPYRHSKIYNDTMTTALWLSRKQFTDSIRRGYCHLPIPWSVTSPGYCSTSRKQYRFVWFFNNLTKLWEVKDHLRYWGKVFFKKEVSSATRRWNQAVVHPSYIKSVWLSLYRRFTRDYCSGACDIFSACSGLYRLQLHVVEQKNFFITFLMLSNHSSVMVY